MKRNYTKTVKETINNYLVESAFDYASDCLEKNELTIEEIKKFVVDDIKRVKDYEIKRNYGLVSETMIIDYLQGLSLSISFTYYDDVKLYLNWIESDKTIQDLTEKEIFEIDKKYWHVLAREISKWF